MDEVMLWDEEGWKCQKHPSRPGRGLCPHCLRDRLLRLCPDCAQVRPCACLPSSSSSSSSLSSSLSSSDLVSRSDRVSASDRISRPEVGAVGRVAQLLEGEPAFRRSSSSTVPFLWQRSDAEGTAQARARWWSPIWLFGSGATASRKEPEGVAAKMGRSRSVVVESYPRHRDVGGEKKCSGGEKAKGWGWYFPSPMWAFKHRKSAKIVQERSPTSQS